MNQFSYSDNLVPIAYHCSSCGNAGVKLWRQYNVFACFVELLCVDCARKDQGVDYEVDARGYHDGGDGLGPCDQIEWLVPAVPTEDGYTYWGYTSVPWAGCQWWDGLPLIRPRWQAIVATILMLLPLMLVFLGD